MAWLRAGTVAVTSGSTTVTGTNTGFAANTRVGDAFIGPDGRQYELQNVASDTVISLASPYLGPTAAGQSYAVMPVQGYQKLLADQVRDWTGQYGQKMAALGSTGNYDVLPVAKGGTGGADQASGRAGLGLGSAATALLTVNSTDATPGRVLKVGDFGVGSTAIPTTTNLGAIPVSGSYRFGPTATDKPAAAQYGSVSHTAYDQPTGNWVQFVLGTSPAVALFRSSVNGTKTGWLEFYHTGNTTRGSGGALSAASPIVRIASVSDSQRLDLQEQTFEPAGAWGVANDEARGATVERLAVGEYRVMGSLGLALEGWRTQDPCSPYGGRTLGISESQQDDDGTVIIRLFKQRWTLSEDGEMIPGRGAPLDVPLNSWIDVRLNMPKTEETPAPPAPEAK
ncbi:hypothetical protein J4P02_22340 [Pseudomonas sp. NFXW11]|uniref:phage tail fiber protein n=1 Tax=Pseudomonas sp. NFXW11 TaxID=2819531 RepID=UPI003CF0F13A